MTRALREDEKPEVLRLYATGLYARQVAEMVGKTMGQVYWTLHKAGVVRPKGPPRKVSVEQAATMYQQGMSSPEVSKALGVSKQLILLRLREADVVRPVKLGAIHCPNLPWRELARKEYHAGKTTPEVAKVVGKSTAQVWRMLSAEGIIRPTSFYSKQKTGAKNGNWRGGASFAPYPVEFNEQLKTKIRTRDGDLCCLCGITAVAHRLKFQTRSGKGHLLSIHHIDYNKANCSDTNLITLCMRCNPGVNSNRAKWTEHFQSLLAERTSANYS